MELRDIKPFLNFTMNDKTPFVFLLNLVIWIVDAFLLVSNPRVASLPIITALVGLLGFMLQYATVYSTYLFNEKNWKIAAERAVIHNTITLVVFSIICFLCGDSFFSFLCYTCGVSIAIFLFTFYKKSKS